MARTYEESCANLEPVRLDPLPVRPPLRRSTLEEDLETMVAHGHCICFEMVNGVLRYSDWFVHPSCPKHGGPHA